MASRGLSNTVNLTTCFWVPEFQLPPLALAKAGLAPSGFPGGSMIKNPPAMQESQEKQVQSLGREDALEEGMATHSSRGAWWATKRLSMGPWTCPSVSALFRLPQNPVPG